MNKSLEKIVSYSNYQNRVVYNQQVVEAAKADAHLHLERALTNDGVITDTQKITFFEKYQLPSYHNLLQSQMETHKMLLKEQFVALIEQQKMLLEGPHGHPEEYLQQSLELSAHLSLVIEEAQALYELRQACEAEKKSDSFIA